MKKMLGATLMAATAMAAAPGLAVADDGMSVRFSGYGTLGGVVTNRDDVQFVQGYNQSHGATKSMDLGVDSRLGAQVDYRLNDTFSAVGQVLASRRNGTETPRLEWLFGQAEVGSGVSLRAGRMVLPTFLLSDVRAVGFAQHWIRTPVEVYALYPSSSFDGGQVQWRPRFGDTNVTAQLSVGKGQTSRFYGLGLDAYLHVKKLRSLNLVAENGNWTARFGVTQTNGVLEQPGLGTLANITDRFSGFGLQYDDGNWLVLSELVVRRQDKGGAFNSNSYYVSGGHRFGAWLPYLTYSEFKPKGVAYGPQPVGQTTAAGVRWDVIPKLALKAQLETTRPSTQALTPGVPLTTYERIKALSVAAEFVF